VSELDVPVRLRQDDQEIEGRPWAGANESARSTTSGGGEEKSIHSLETKRRESREAHDGAKRIREKERSTQDAKNKRKVEP